MPENKYGYKVQQITEATDLKTDCKALSIVNKGATTMYVESEPFETGEGVNIGIDDPNGYLYPTIKVTFENNTGLAYVRKLVKQ